jgi:rhamnosyltransferase
LIDFLIRRNGGFSLLFEWVDYQLISYFRSIKKTVVAIYNPKGAIKNDQSWVLYSSFDSDSQISSHVLAQVREFARRGFSVMFISTSPRLDDRAREKLSDHCKVIIHRKNIGHDFGSWKTGYLLVKPWLKRDSIIILSNDSCFGPYHSLEGLFGVMTTYPDSVVGISKSYLIEEHIQSYFLAFGVSVVRAGIFDRYMERIRLLSTKEAIVRFYEVGGSAFLRKRGISLRSLIDPSVGIVAQLTQNLNCDNALKDPIGRELVERGLSPFYKRSNGAPLDMPLYNEINLGC